MEKAPKEERRKQEHGVKRGGSGSISLEWYQELAINDDGEGSGQERSRKSESECLETSSRSVPGVRIHGVAAMNGLVTLAMIVLNVIKTTGDCPRSCECKWKSGKESVVCVNANMTEIPRQLDSGTQVLVLTGNRLQRIGADEFFNASLLNLQKIFLSKCKLRVIDRCSFRKIINLVELDLSYNDLNSVPSHTFEFIKELRELKLNGNPIVRLLNYAFKMVPRLTKLDLSECRIAYVEMKAFLGLENSLEWLKLDKNKIANVEPRAFVGLANLHGLELSGNSWNCSCGLRTLREWMLRQNVPYGVPPTCKNPPRLSGKIWDKLELDEFACPPRTEAVTSRKNGREGSNVTLSCSVEGVPEPSVRWLRKNRAIANASAAGDGVRKKLYVVRTEARTSNLTILWADAQDNGIYVCRAENKAGRSEANVTFAVTAKPFVKIWSPRVVVAFGAVSLLFAAAVGLLACCARSLTNRKSYVRHDAAGRHAADAYEMKHKNNVGGCGNHCSSADGHSERKHPRSSTTDASDKGESDSAEVVGAKTPEGGTPSPRSRVSTADGPKTRGNSVGAPDGDSFGFSRASCLFLASEPRKPRSSDAIGENSPSFTSALLEEERKFPDLLELSRNEENFLNNNPFSTVPKKRSCRTKRPRWGSFGSESRSPLLAESSGDSWDSTSSCGRAPFERTASPPPSPGGPSQTPILDILEGSSDAFAESPTALRCKSWELEKFLKEYRILQDQLYRMKESCESLREDNLKYREIEIPSTAVESATISKLIPSVYLEGPPFRAAFPEDADDFAALFHGTAFLEEDNNNTTSAGKANPAGNPNQLLGDGEAYWSGRSEFLDALQDSRNSCYKS